MTDDVCDDDNDDDNNSIGACNEDDAVWWLTIGDGLGGRLRSRTAVDDQLLLVDFVETEAISFVFVPFGLLLRDVIVVMELNDNIDRLLPDCGAGDCGCLFRC